MIARKPLVSSPMSQSIAKPDAKLAPQQGAAPDGVHRLSLTHIYPGTLTGTQVVARLESGMIPCMAPTNRWNGDDGRSNGRRVTAEERQGGKGCVITRRFRGAPQN